MKPQIVLPQPPSTNVVFQVPAFRSPQITINSKALEYSDEQQNARMSCLRTISRLFFIPILQSFVVGEDVTPDSLLGFWKCFDAFAIQDDRERLATLEEMQRILFYQGDDPALLRRQLTQLPSLGTPSMCKYICRYIKSGRADKPRGKIDLIVAYAAELWNCAFMYTLSASSATNVFAQNVDSLFVSLFAHDVAPDLNHVNGDVDNDLGDANRFYLTRLIAREPCYRNGFWEFWKPSGGSLSKKALVEKFVANIENGMAISPQNILAFLASTKFYAQRDFMFHVCQAAVSHIPNPALDAPAFLQQVQAFGARVPLIRHPDIDRDDRNTDLKILINYVAAVLGHFFTTAQDFATIAEPASMPKYTQLCDCLRFAALERMRELNMGACADRFAMEYWERQAHASDEPHKSRTLLRRIIRAAYAAEGIPLDHTYSAEHLPDYWHRSIFAYQDALPEPQVDAMDVDE